MISITTHLKTSRALIKIDTWKLKWNICSMTQPEIHFRKQVSSDCNKSEHPPTNPTEERMWNNNKGQKHSRKFTLQQERKPVVICVWLQETRLRGFLQTPLCCGRFRVSRHTCGRQALEGRDDLFQEMMMSWQINIKTTLTVWPSLHYFLKLDSFLEEVWLSVCVGYMSVCLCPALQAHSWS